MSHLSGRRPILVLDLDETLFYTHRKDLSTRYRPGLRSFFTEVQEAGFHVMVATQGTREYAREKVGFLMGKYGMPRPHLICAREDWKAARLSAGAPASSSSAPFLPSRAIRPDAPDWLGGARAGLGEGRGPKSLGTMGLDDEKDRVVILDDKPREWEYDDMCVLDTGSFRPKYSRPSASPGSSTLLVRVSLHRSSLYFSLPSGGACRAVLRRVRPGPTGRPATVRPGVAAGRARVAGPGAWRGGE